MKHHQHKHTLLKMGSTSEGTSALHLVQPRWHKMGRDQKWADCCSSENAMSGRHFVVKATVDKDEGEGPVLLMDLDSSNGTRMISDTSRVQCSPCEQCVIHAGDVMVSAGVPFKLIRSITSRVVRKRKLSEAGMSDTQTPPHHSSSPSMPSTSSSPSGGTNSAFITCHQPDITSSGSPEF
mmetsp:Transcript_12067/g.19313  ORF Transcript_12067/g.19313 Transcript_12067/m.19313 type:complete len:180 (-) Transcript_12067:98-637(-)